MWKEGSIRCRTHAAYNTPDSQQENIHPFLPPRLNSVQFVKIPSTPPYHKKKSLTHSSTQVNHQRSHPYRTDERRVRELSSCPPTHSHSIQRYLSETPNKQEINRIAPFRKFILYRYTLSHGIRLSTRPQIDRYI